MRQRQSYRFPKLPKIQSFKFCNNRYTRHTLWSCLIRCANMKWIWLVLWKIQSGHDFVHRRTDRGTDRRTDDVKPVYPTFNFVEAEGIISPKSTQAVISLQWRRFPLTSYPQLDSRKHDLYNALKMNKHRWEPRYHANVDAGDARNIDIFSTTLTFVHKALGCQIYATAEITVIQWSK